MKKEIIIVICCGVLLIFIGLRAYTPTSFAKTATPSKTNSLALRKRINQCAGDSAFRRVTFVMGAWMTANADEVDLPPGCGFQSEKEARVFRRQADSASLVVGGKRIELQRPVIEVLKFALVEARRKGLEITPKGEHPAWRSFKEQQVIWQEQIQEGVDYWRKKGKISRVQRDTMLSASVDEQIAEVLQLEKRKLYFGTGFGKSILQSVAPPNATQHTLGLALDIRQYDNPRIRELLAKYGFFQTVTGDPTHFTYLGFPQNKLEERGLTQFAREGFTYWVLDERNLAAASKPAPTGKPTKPKGSRRPTAQNNDDSGLPQILRNGGKIARQPTVKAAPKATPAATKTSTEASPNSLPANIAGLPVELNKGVIITQPMVARIREFAEPYQRRTKKKLRLTSGRRRARDQARAMRGRWKAYGKGDLRALYGRKTADPMIAAFESSNHQEEQIQAGTVVVLWQVRLQPNLYKHMRENAVDVSRHGTNLPVLKEVVAEMGGKVVPENDNYHVQLNAD